MHWLLVVHEPPFGRRPHEPFTHIAGEVHWGGVVVAVVQLFVQFNVVVSQRPGAQFVFAGVTQVPVPLHAEGGRRVDAVGHAAGRHCVPDGWKAQAPPAHWPVVPQDVAAVEVQRLSAPELMLLQTPTEPARLQALQAAVQAALQQTPWAQKLLLHSFPAEHVAPFGFRPQLLIMPFMPQMLGEMHWALVVHASKHRLALHRYGKHGRFAGLMHWPDALQVDGPA
jgi:hypothetical protein